MPGKRPIIFSDFDGTFTARDVGNRVFTKFSEGRNRQLVEDWKKGLMSSRECLRREAELISITPDEFYSFVGSFELADGAAKLHVAATGNDIPFILLSDGLDLYIEHILKLNQLDGVPFHANRGILKNNGLTIDFPYDNNSCRRCGSCKGERIREITAGDHGSWEVIFIGDGLSDICALSESDIIFARGDLLKYCSEHHFDAIEYQNFFDILKWLKDSGRITGEYLK